MRMIKIRQTPFLSTLSSWCRCQIELTSIINILSVTRVKKLFVVQMLSLYTNFTSNLNKIVHIYYELEIWKPANINQNWPERSLIISYLCGWDSDTNLKYAKLRTFSGKNLESKKHQYVHFWRRNFATWKILIGTFSEMWRTFRVTFSQKKITTLKDFQRNKKKIRNVGNIDTFPLLRLNSWRDCQLSHAGVETKNQFVLRYFAHTWQTWTWRGKQRIN